MKTRLARTLGDEGAAELYRAMLRDVLAGAQSVAESLADMKVMVFHTPPDAFERQSDSLRLFWASARQPQAEGDLSTRLFNCFQVLRAEGFGRIVVIGSDAPDLPTEILARAFSVLNDHELVFGPAQDGGFYLMGASCAVSSHWFRGVQWSSSSTLNDILANVADATVALLPLWSDVDDEDDVWTLRERLRSGQSIAPQTYRVLDGAR